MWPKLLVCLITFAVLAPARAEAAFPKLDVPLQTWKLFDLGVTDLDSDGRLDLFTANHKFDASLLRNSRSGWIEAYDRIGLSPTPGFPGFESVRSGPALSEAGLHLFASIRPEPGDPFHLRAVDRSASGVISLAARWVRIERTIGAEATISPGPDGRRLIEFKLAPGGAIDFAVDHHDLPLDVHVNPPLPAAEIRVGADAAAATTRSFRLRLRDRHAIGFGDFDSDGRSDLLIVSGGLGGAIFDPFYANERTNELLLWSGRRLRDATAASGLRTVPCRGRGIDIADLDGDGNLDALIACEGGPAQVALGDGSGRLVPAAAPDVAAASYRLLDVTGDRRPELLASDGRQAQLWRLTDGGWSLAQKLRLRNRGGEVSHFALGDVDADGRLDALALSIRGNTLLLNRGGRLLPRDPRRTLGLPTRRSVAGAFVDYDNDGDLDLHLIPQGLFERKPKRYRPSGRLRSRPLPRGAIRSGTVTWADLDGDGRRDPLSVRARGAFVHDQVVELRRNATRSGSWLQLDLTGPAGNTEAIGAKVRVQSRQGAQFGWVGASDDSAHSSGHYRIYFGLGDARRVRRLVVRWPDGSRTARRNLRVDRLVRLSHRDAAGRTQIASP